MTKTENDNGQIATAATRLANYVLKSTDYYHVSTVRNSDVEYFSFYLTSGLEMNVAYAVGQFLNGQPDALETCWTEKPEGFVPSGLPKTIALEIARRASSIIQGANNLAMIRAQSDRLSEVDQSVRLRA